MPPLCASCGVRYVWFEDRGLCGVCGHEEPKPKPEPRPRAQGERGCSVEGCERKHRGRGLCNKHWIQLYRAERRAAEQQRQQQDEQKDEGQTWRS